MLVTMAATKGGAGKTTTAVCLMFAALERGLDVVLIDVDPQGTGAKWAREHATVIQSPTIVPADIVAAGRGHDLVIIDTPPGADDRTLAAIEAADVVVAPTGLGPGEIDGLAHVVELVDPDFVIPTRYDARRAIHGHGLEYLRRLHGTKVTAPVPSATSIEWAQAQQEALPPLSPPAIAYRSILDLVVPLTKKGGR